MSAKLPTNAQKILETITYATIATVTVDGQPWNSPVYCAVDADHTIYWGSHIDSQHSRNLAANNRAFIVVYDSTAEPGTGAGVYLQVTCEQLTDYEEVEKAHALIQGRRPSPYWTLDEVRGDSPVRLYRAVPRKIWMNSEGEKSGIYIDTRKELLSLKH